MRRFSPAYKKASLAVAIVSIAIRAHGQYYDIRYGAMRFSDGLCPMYDSRSGRMGYVDRAGSWAIPPDYSIAMPFSEGLALTFDEDRGGRRSRFRFIDARGQVAFEVRAAVNVAGEGLSGGYALFSIEGDARYPAMWISVNAKGETAAVIEGVSFRHGFSEGLAFGAGGHPSRTGWYDPTGALAVPAPEAIDARPFSEGLAYYTLADRRLRCVDRRGKAVFELPPGSGVVSGFKNGLSLIYVTSPHLWEYRLITPKGDAIARWSNSTAWIFGYSRGWLLVRHPEGFGYLDPADGSWKVAPRWQLLGPFSEGLAWVLSGGRIGFVDERGAIAIEPKWPAPSYLR
jgi:hypothetical protein